MIKIASDTPSELLELFPKLKFNGNEKQVMAKVKQLRSANDRYGLVPKRADKPKKMTIERVDKKYQVLANYVSLLDFSKFKGFTRTGAILYIKNFLKLEGYL